MVRSLDSEPSAISTSSVDGSALDPEPSMKSTSTVDGSPPDARTFRDIDLQHGRFALWYLNHPRYMPSAWTVHPIDIEPSAILRLSMDGSALDPAPSALRGCVSLISCYTSNVKTWRKMPDPLGYDEKGSSQA